MNLNNLTIKQALSGFKKKEFSCEELVRDCLAQIEETNKKLNSYLFVNHDEAITRAKEKDSCGNTQNQPLWGIPIAVKDLYLTKNMRTTAGAKLLEDYLPSYNATAVDKLLQAGAVIIGKTNCDAWAHGASGENSDFGPALNPFDLSRTPGGSSSGSAVAVASQTCLASMGTDTGGSIRLPASFCNVVGLKPSYGLVSRYGVIAMASSLDSMGHFTKTVEDSALILEATAGQDAFDDTTVNLPVNRYSEKIEVIEPSKIKIGIIKEYFTLGLDKQIEEKFRLSVKKMEQNGFRIEEVSLPYTKYALAIYYLIQTSEVSSNLARYDGIRFGKKRNGFSQEAKRRIMLGTFALSAGYYEAYYAKAKKVQQLLTKDVNQIFKQVDLLMAPVSPSLPFKIGEKSQDPLQMYLADIYTVTANLTGIPALAVPNGFINQLPVGVQFMAPKFNESLLFQTGSFFEKLINEKQ